jgi:hypothetical protein
MAINQQFIRKYSGVRYRRRLHRGNRDIRPSTCHLYWIEGMYIVSRQYCFDLKLVILQGCIGPGTARLAINVRSS